MLSGVDLDIRAARRSPLSARRAPEKTTLCSLLPRFYEIGSGVDLDRRDRHPDDDACVPSRADRIVQQDVFLFGGTIRENIAYGRHGASEAEIVEAAQRARLDTLLQSLPDGLDTVIGERGVKLSGGQKQRLSIARIFLKNPSILILDEATSSLDTQTEREIQQSLAVLSQGRTTLVIAHRLATIRNADRIVVIDRSGVVEQGAHDQLIGAGARTAACTDQDECRRPRHLHA